MVWKDFPLTQIHPQAFVAAQAGNCAREQGKFWELHDKLFANQSALQPDALKKYAADTGLDAAKFNQCLDSSKYEARVQEALGAGDASASPRRRRCSSTAACQRRAAHRGVRIGRSTTS